MYNSYRKDERGDSLARFETHAHSHYSNIRIIDSLCKPEDLILTAAALGYKGITLTDHEALCGHVEWLELEKSFKEKGKIPQDFVCGLGNEIYLTETREQAQKYWHFILIAKNTLGHRALRELSSGAWLNSYRYRGLERVPTLKTELAAIVKKYPNTLIATNSCLSSELDVAVLRLVDAEAINDSAQILEAKQTIENYIKFCLELFGDDFYIEIAPGTSNDQRKFNKRIKPIAQFYGIKMIVATDAHYPTAADREIHKSFLNSKDGEREVDAFYYDAHLMDDDEAYNNIKDFYSEQEWDKMRANSLEIMEKIEGYNIFHNPIIPQVAVPQVEKRIDSSLNNYPVLKNLLVSDNDQERYWANECLNALTKLNIYEKVHLERLELEARIIKDIGEKLENCLFAYFNTFQHYIDLFWECGSVTCPGRGSAGSYLSNYLLGITQADPVVWNLPYFRFLNEDRVELPDIDIDLCAAKRPLIFQKIREERGELNVVQVATFGTESLKAAIQCACKGYRSDDCPSGIDIDVAKYLSSLVPVERGQTWSFDDCFYGNEEKGRAPVKALISQIEQYPGLKEIIKGVEGLIVRRGQHASGVMMYNNTPYETTALMRSPNGDITTQFDLHRAEKMGDTKFDFLITEACDKISTAIDLLIEAGYFDKTKTKREIYNEILHPKAMKLDDPKIWEALASGLVQDVFQFNTEIGIQTAKQIKPKTPAEMTTANALLRLAAPEGQERPLDRYLKFKNNINLWYQEMDEAGLSKEEQQLLEPYYLRDYGVPCSQEQLMLMVMDPKISHFTLAESNSTRKVLAKKMTQKIPEVKEKFISQCPTKALGEYCWRTMMLPQMSYSFSEVHSLFYSFVGIQTLVLATQYPEVYWNTACLIVNSQSTSLLEEQNSDEGTLQINDIEDIGAEPTILQETDDDDDDDEDDETPAAAKKKKGRAIPYGKIAAAIGKIVQGGAVVSLPDINESTYTFTPDVERNMIRYGLSGISKVGDEVVKAIIANRPYSSFDDFCARIKLSKPQMVNLIKCGAFDSFGDRVEIMRQYITSIADVKKRLTLQNVKMLIDNDLIPNDYDFQRRVFNFNKYIKALKLDGTYYGLDNIAYNFYSANFDVDKLESAQTESGFKIKQKDWDKYYKCEMECLKKWIKDNEQNLLSQLNSKIIGDLWNKYCLGSVSAWEMDSVSFYSHKHELAHLDCGRYDIADFSKLPENPEIERIIPIKGKNVPILKLSRICGTVLDRDKNKHSVTLLTTSGVVNVKIFGNVFANYDKQISERGADGKKHVIEPSAFKRGNKIVVCGVRDGDSFRAKKYKNTPYHTVQLITAVHEDGTADFHSRGEQE